MTAISYYHKGWSDAARPIDFLLRVFFRGLSGLTSCMYVLAKRTMRHGEGTLHVLGQPTPYDGVGPSTPPLSVRFLRSPSAQTLVNRGRPQR